MGMLDLVCFHTFTHASVTDAARLDARSNHHEQTRKLECATMIQVNTLTGIKSFRMFWIIHLLNFSL